MSRKPKIKDKIEGAKCFFWDMLESFILFRFERAQFDWVMIQETIKGNFDVMDEEDEEVLKGINKQN